MTDLEKLLDFFAQVDEEVNVDTEYPWEAGEPLATVVSLGDGCDIYSRFIFDHQGKYLTKWLDFPRE